MNNRIRELRCERGLRQEDLAALINVSQQTVSRLESGENSLPAEVLITLAEYFQVSVDYLLYLSESRKGRDADMEAGMGIRKNRGFMKAFSQLDKNDRLMVNNLILRLRGR